MRDGAGGHFPTFTRGAKCLGEHLALTFGTLRVVARFASRAGRGLLSVRGLMAAVAVVALALYSYRFYEDGPATRWLLLRLRHGSVQTRRGAAREIQKAGVGDLVGIVFGSTGSDPASRRERERRSGLYVEALLRASTDPDAACRAVSVKALGLVAINCGSERVRRHALLAILAAVADHDASVRAAACSSFAGLVTGRGESVVVALGSALRDRSPEVRRAAAHELGVLGAIHGPTQEGVAPLLVGLLTGRDDPAARVEAVRGLGLFGSDHRRHPPGGGPDVAPALASALGDPVAEVRREAARVLGSTTFGAGGAEVASWAGRGAAIAPALSALLSKDEDKGARQEAALALFALGERGPAVLKAIEQGAESTERWRSRRSLKALERRRTEVGNDKPE